MNTIDPKRRTEIVNSLCQGSPIRAIAKATGASKNTVSRLLAEAGKACTVYLDEHVCHLTARRIQVREVFSFANTKRGYPTSAKATRTQYADDTWTWTAMDADSMLLIWFLVGALDSEYARQLIDGVQSRLVNRVQPIREDNKIYLQASDGTITSDADHEMLVQLYGRAPERRNRQLSSEKNNTLRKVETHTHAVALHVLFHNYIKRHPNHRESPAVVAGITDRTWDIGDIVGLVEANNS